ncbi:MAG: hypothetical protein PVH88_21255 [Ignavibacteria bacterium]
MLEMLPMKDRQRFFKEFNAIKDEPDYRTIPALLWRLTLLEFDLKEGHYLPQILFPFH